MVETLDTATCVARIVDALRRGRARPPYTALSATSRPVEPPAFVLVVGAGFSTPVVPMVDALVKEWIGRYDAGGGMQDGEGTDLPWRAARRRSAAFWRAFNEHAAAAGAPPIELGAQGLPADPADAYQRLFDERVTGRLVAPAAGRHYAEAFLRYVLAPGSEHGNGLTGIARSETGAPVNRAHRELAVLLSAQQRGRWPGLRPFCRTLMTTNFDSLLLAALAAESVLPIVSDRPERGFDQAMFDPPGGPVHIVHLHGSVLRGNPASTPGELGALEQCNAEVLATQLAERSVLVLGHSGWRDAVVRAPGLRDSAHPLRRTRCTGSTSRRHRMRASRRRCRA